MLIQNKKGKLKFKQTSFKIDGDFGPFIGWTNGRKSDGWDCPYFEKEEADKIVLKTNSYEDVKSKFAKYDERSDSYVFPIYNGDELEDTDIFKGKFIDTPKGQIKVYGFTGWTWEEE